MEEKKHNLSIYLSISLSVILKTYLYKPNKGLQLTIIFIINLSVLFLINWLII